MGKAAYKEGRAVSAASHVCCVSLWGQSHLRLSLTGGGPVGPVLEPRASEVAERTRDGAQSCAGTGRRGGAPAALAEDLGS